MKKFVVLLGMFLCAVLMYATNLQTAIKDVAVQFSSTLKPRSVVAIIGIYSENAELSDFMMDELTLHFIKIKKLTIADRVNLAAIKKEMNFQLSGEVGDESIQQLGAKIGAETVIQGVLKQYGGVFTLTIRALNVKTAAVSDMYRMNVELGEVEMNMLGMKAKRAKKILRTTSGKPINPTLVGFENMLFGLGSYMSGHYGDGAFLTATHAIAWIFLGAGSAMMAIANSGPTSAARPNAGLTGIILISLYPFIELTAIIYGAIRPYYYEGPSIIATSDKSGLMFNLALTPKGNITPQVSYIFRY